MAVVSYAHILEGSYAYLLHADGWSIGHASDVRTFEGMMPTIDENFLADELLHKVREIVESAQYNYCHCVSSNICIACKLGDEVLEELHLLKDTEEIDSEKT